MAALFQLADDKRTYGNHAGWWMVATDDLEHELAGPYEGQSQAERERRKWVTCWQAAPSPQYPVTLIQRGVDRFTVIYGKQIDRGLTYTGAAAKLGQAIMHALACEGRLDNRIPGE